MGQTCCHDCSLEEPATDASTPLPHSIHNVLHTPPPLQIAEPPPSEPKSTTTRKMPPLLLSPSTTTTGPRIPWTPTNPSLAPSTHSHVGIDGTASMVIMTQSGLLERPFLEDAKRQQHEQAVKKKFERSTHNRRSLTVDPHAAFPPVVLTPNTNVDLHMGHIMNTTTFLNLSKLNIDGSCAANHNPLTPLMSSRSRTSLTFGSH